MTRPRATLLATALLLGLAAPAQAENQMGYRLLTPQDAARLPQYHGVLGLDVERAQQIADQGLVFDLLRIRQVRRGSTGEQAGLRPGDQIIAVDGHVFPSATAFAAYVGSIAPGSRIHVDYMPDGAGPQQAQRLTVAVGAPGMAPPPMRGRSDGPAPPGMTTGEKVEIGLGAAALLGCYEMGCFSRRQPAQPPGYPQQQDQRGQQYQQPQYQPLPTYRP